MHDTIKQMAQMFGVTEHTLRFYTGKGLLPCARTPPHAPPRRSQDGGITAHGKI